MDLLEGLAVAKHEQARIDNQQALRGAYSSRISGERIGASRGMWRVSRTLAAIRDTLLPKLLSGELPVADAAKQLEAVL